MSKRRPRRRTKSLSAEQVQTLQQGTPFADIINPLQIFLLFAEPLPDDANPERCQFFQDCLARFAGFGWVIATTDATGKTTWSITAKGHQAFSRGRTRH